MVDLLKEYKDMFLRIFFEMNGIVGSLGEIKIQLKLDAKPIKKRPYRPNPKYKDRMLDARIIVAVEESQWISPMVVQPKKTGDLRICVDLRSLNAACVHDPFSTPFTDEVLENVGGCEAYTYGFLGYHQVRIMEEDSAKTTSATEWGSFAYIVMPFGLKNASAVFFRIVDATFKEFMHKFLEVYLDDWTIFNLLKEHMQGLWLMLDRCRKLQISLN